jgi:hypothetical protein
VICTKALGPGEVMYVACDECGHAMVLHRGLLNPSLKACLVCTVIADQTWCGKDGVHRAHWYPFDTSGYCPGKG